MRILLQLSLGGEHLGNTALGWRWSWSWCEEKQNKQRTFNISTPLWSQNFPNFLVSVLSWHFLRNLFSNSAVSVASLVLEVHQTNRKYSFNDISQVGEDCWCCWYHRIETTFGLEMINRASQPCSSSHSQILHGAL